MPMPPVWSREYAAVLFDLDGTLVDSTEVVERVWTEWAAGRGIPVEQLAGHHGVPTAQILAKLVPADEVAAEHRRIEAIEVAAAGGITLLPGAAEALAAVGPHLAAIVTSCSAPLALARIAATGLTAPHLVVTASDVPVGKPDPAPYRLAAERLGLRPSDCLAVEDAPAGITSARAAGCRTLGLATTHPAAALAADAVVGTLADVRFVRSGPDGTSVAVRAVGAAG